jgi:hypothetical protein
MKAMTAEMMAVIERNMPDKHFRDILGIILDALKINPPLYLPSILGPFRTWIPPYDGYSEFKILDLWRLKRTVKYLVNTLIPSIPSNPPPFGPPILDNTFWHPTVILQRPDHNGSYTTFPEEGWFFINGIMTNDSVAQLNAAYLAYLFHRPITLIQNSTDSFWIDLLECTIGKEWNRMTEPAVKAFPPIYHALKDERKKKVVVIAHSQGTIIMANILTWLKFKAACTDSGSPPKPPIIPEITKFNVVAVEPEQLYTPAEPVFVYPDNQKLSLSEFAPLKEDELAKLEVYCFANCASEMKYYKPAEGDNRPVPWIENFGNEYDIVARLGMLAPRPDEWGIDIDGPCYMHRDAWGHLLNANYLSDIQQCQKQGRKEGGKGDAAPYELLNADDFPSNLIPQLFSYINGGVTG